jgi:hypothetical protein
MEKQQTSILVFGLLIGEATNTNFLVFGLTQSGLELFMDE